MSVGIAPRQIDPLVYTGSDLPFVPCTTAPRAPETRDVNYPLLTLWRNGNKSAVLPDQEGDLYYLARFIPNGTNAPLADWRKFSTGGSGGIFSWVEVTASPQAMQVGTGYIANTGSLLTFTLPSSSIVGDVIRIVGKGAGLYTIAQLSGQVVYFGSIASSVGVGGSVTSNNQHDAIELVCITDDTEWAVLSSIGNFTLV